MRRFWKRLGPVLINGALLIGLIGVLVAYVGIAGDLSSRVYTVEQQDFLAYNNARMVNQAPIFLGIVDSQVKDGETGAGALPPLPLAGWGTEVDVTLDARYEEQEGVSVTLYDLEFSSAYELRYPGPAVTSTVMLHFPFPNNLETLHDVEFRVDGVEPEAVTYGVDGIRWQKVMEKGEAHRLEISYRADGAQSFTYALNQGVRFDTLDVRIAVVGLEGSEVPRASLPTTGVTGEAGRETFVWSYAGLIPNRDIRLTLPQRLSFSQRVAALQSDLQTLATFAPVWVLLFLVSLAGLLYLDGERLPISAYLLVGLIFVLFYPALTFLSGLVEMTVASAIVFVVISAIITGFLSLLLGWRKCLVDAFWLLVILLGCFSLGMLTPWSEGALTLGGILLIGTFMWRYAHRSTSPEPLLGAHAPSTETAPASTCEEEPAVPPELSATRCCPRCGEEVASTHAFCPACGYDLRRYRVCQACGHEQFVPTDIDEVYCQRCGTTLSRE